MHHDAHSLPWAHESCDRNDALEDYALARALTHRDLADQTSISRDLLNLTCTYRSVRLSEPTFEHAERCAVLGKSRRHPWSNGCDADMSCRLSGHRWTRVSCTCRRRDAGSSSPRLLGSIRIRDDTRHTENLGKPMEPVIFEQNFGRAVGRTACCGTNRNARISLSAVTLGE